MVYDGSAKMGGGSLGAFLARVPACLQWLLGVNGITLKAHQPWLSQCNSLVTSSGSTKPTASARPRRIAVGSIV